MRSNCRHLLAVGAILLLQNTVCGQECRESPVDVFFIAESSLDVGRAGFTLLKKFIGNVAKNIGIGQNSNRISITLFNKEVLNVLDVKDSRGLNELNKVLGRMDFWTAGHRTTNIGKALEFTTNAKFGGMEVDRPGGKAVCILIVEGVSSDISEEPAKELRKHCRVLVLGIKRPNYFELSKIVSAPTMGHLKTLQDYIDLVRFDKWAATTICKPPIAAMQLKRGLISRNSIQIVWDSQPYASKYVVQVRLSGKTKALKVKQAPRSSNNMTFTGLKEGTSYSFDAWPFDVDGIKGTRSVLFVSSGIQVPKMTLDVLTMTRTTARVSWLRGKVPGVSYYVTVREAKTQQLVIGVGVPSTSYRITKLRPGTSYSVQLTAIYRGARSETDQRLIFHTVPDPPVPKTIYVTDRAIRLEWKQIQGASSYGIRTYDTETGSGIELLVRVDETRRTAFEIEPLLSGKRYKFTVTAKTSEGTESEESRPVFGRVAPSNPRRIQLISRTTNSINISWDAPEGVTRYKVQFKVSLSPDFVTRLVDMTYFYVDELTAGAMYVFNVFSVGQDSASDTKNPAVANIQTVPSKVESLLIQGITQNSVKLQWTKMRGAKEYLLRFKDANTKKVLRTLRIEGDIAEVDGLQTGITYLITVAAIGVEGEVTGEESDPQMVITLPAVPERPQLASKTNTTLTFQWDAVQGAIQYVASISADGDTSPVQFRTRSTSFTFDGLTPGTWYDVSLRSVGSGGRINMERSETAKEQTVPEIPKNPRIIELTSTTVTVTWDKVKGAAGYILKVRMVGVSKTLENRKITGNEYTISNLKGGESYHAGLVAYGSDGVETEESELTLVKTMPEAPGKPRVQSVSSSTVTLEWDEVKGASGYVISISDKRSLVEIRAEKNTFTIDNLKPSTQYSFGLYSVAIEGTRNNKESERVEAITAPNPPSEVRVINAATTYVELAWNAVRGAISYVVRYKSIREDEGLESGEVDASNPSFQTVSKLTAGVIYEFSAFAVGLDGSKSDPGILIDGTLPATPDKPLVLLIGSTTATLSWNPAKGALSYIIMARAREFEKEFRSNSTRVDIDGLESGTKYEFTLMSVGINGRVNRYESDKKREQTLTSAPTHFKSGATTSTEINLSWDKMKGAVYYSVIVEYADGTPVRKYTAFRTTYTIRRLRPGTSYSISVASIGTNFIESDFTESIVVSTVPDSPSPPQVTVVKDTSLELIWRPVQGATRYTVGVRNVGKIEAEKFNSTESQILVTDLSPGTWYEVFVYSGGSDGQTSAKHSGVTRVQTAPATPSNVTIIKVSIGSVTIQWDKTKGAKLYKVFVSKDDESITNLTTRDDVATVWNLMPGTIYSFVVQVEGEGGQESGRSEVISESTATEAPMQPILTEVTSTMATLEWLDIPGAIRYIVFYVNRDSNERRSENVTDTKIILRNLEPGTWYDFSVMSIGAGEKPSEEGDILDEQTVPVTPTNVQVRSVGVDFINVVWDKSKGASSYRASYSYRNERNELKENTIRIDRAAVRFSGLLPGTEYQIVVRSVGQTGSVSPGTKPVKENTIPVTPVTPVLKAVETKMFQIDWEPVKGASSYVVEIAPEIGRKLYRETEKPEWTEHDAEPGKWFQVNVQSKDSKNRGNGIPSDTIDIQTICLQPSNVLMSEIGTTWVKFNWDEMEGADFYLVTMLWSVKDDIINTFGGQEVQDGKIILLEGDDEKKKDGIVGGTLEHYKIVSSLVVVKDHIAWFRIQTRSHNIRIEGLDPATSYEFQFETVNEQGRVSEQKTQLKNTTLPNKVEFISLFGITESSAMLGWDAVEGVYHYIVNVTRQLDGFVEAFTTQESTITLQRLVPGSWYNAEVFAVGASGNVNYMASEPVSFQTTPSRPTNVESVNITTTSIELKWNEGGGVSNYRVIIRLTRPFNVLFRVDESRSNRHVVEKLSPGTRYLFTVVSVTAEGRESRPSRLLLETTIPATPANFRLMDISTTGASLQWDDVAGAFQFIVTVSGDDGTKKEMRTKGTVLTIEDLTPGTWYEFWIRSVGMNGKVNRKESNIIRRQTVPQAPTPLRIEKITATTISLSWRKVHGIKHYQVFIEDGDGSQQMFNVTRSHHTLSQLTPGSSYKIHVIAVSTSGQRSQKSNTIIPATVPSSVVELEVIGVSSNHVELKWTPVTGATEYTIIVRPSDSESVLMNINTRQSSHVVTSLDPGITYVFSVTVKGRNGKKSGESQQIRVQTTPLSPTSVKSGNVTTTTIELNWKAVPGVRLYKVIIREQAFHDVIWRTDEVQKATHTVSGLRPGTTYLLGVVTVGTSGPESVISEIITETTLPERPENLAFTGITTTTLVLEWSPVSGVRHYTVHIEGEDGSNKEVIVLQAKASIPALSPGTWYETYVVAVGVKKKQSQPSERLRDQTEPLPPSKLTVTNTGTTSISVQWEPVVGVKFYEVAIKSTSSGDDDSTQTFVADETDYTINELVPGVEHVITVVGVGTSGRKSDPSEPLRQTTVPAALDEVTVKSTTTTSITLEWLGVAGASGYTIVIRLASDRSGAVSRTIDTSSTLYEVPALLPGENYLFSIRSRGRGGKLSKESPKVRAQTVPLPPSKIQISSAQATIISLTWKAANGAEFYHVITRSKDGKTVKTDDVRGTEHSLTGLEPGTEFLISISSIGRSGRKSVESSTVSQRTRPSSPSGVTVTNIDTTSITVTWQAVKGARSYRVSVEDVDRNKKTQKELETEEYEAFTNRYTATNLQSGTQYAITITSLGIDGQASAPSQRLVEQTVPASPANLVMTDAKETSMSLKWDRVYGATNYFIVVKDPVSGSETRMETKSNQMKIQNLSPGTEYEFSIFSVGNKERVNMKPSKLLIEQTVSSPINGLRVVSVTTSSVTLRWTGSLGVLRYTVRVRDALSGILLNVFESIPLEITIEDLQPGKNYSFTVTSVARNGKESEESNEVTVSTGISTPTQPVVKKVTEISVTLTWDEVEGAREYLVIIHDREGNRKRRITAEEEFVIVTGLLPGYSYSFLLIAIGTSGETSQEGPAANVVTIPAAPEVTSIDSVSTSSITFSWKKVKGAFRYVIVAKWSLAGERRMRHVNATTTETSQEMVLPRPGMNYDITLRSEGASGVSTPSSVLKENTLPLPPPPPTVSNITSDSMTLSWDSVEGAASYEVVLRDRSTGQQKTTIVYRRSAQLTDLIPGTWYRITLFSRDAKQRVNREGSPVVTIQSVPSTPSNLGITEIKISSISLSWTKVKGALSYEIEVLASETDVVIFAPTWKNVDYFDRKVTFVIASNDTTVTVDGLKPGSTFQFDVRSVGDQARKSDAARIEATTLPGTVHEITVKKVSSNSATIEWQDVKGASFYRVRIQEDDDSRPSFHEVQQPSVTMDGLIPGSWYDVSIVTYNIRSRTSGIWSHEKRFQTAPPRIEDAKTSEITTNRMVITWGSVKGASTYEVKLLWSEDDVSPGHLQSEGPADKDGFSHRTYKTAETEVELGQLEPGTMYWYEVSSLSEEGGKSEQSARRNETTLPSSISEITIDAVTETTISLSWDTIKGAEKYAVVITALGANIRPILRETRRPQIFVQELEPGVSYEFVVQPLGQKERKDKIESSNIRVKTIPKAPEKVTVEAFTERSITVSWSASSGTVRYKVFVEYKDESQLMQTTTFETTNAKYQITELRSGLRYNIYIVAYGGRLEISGSKRSKKLVQRTALSRPENLKVDEFGEEHVTLSWESSFGATAYMVFVTDVESGIVTPIEFDGDLKFPNEITNLTPGAVYWFTVRAVNWEDNMMSKHTEKVEQRTKPLPPHSVQVTDVGSDVIALGWKWTLGASSFTIYVAEIGFIEESVVGHKTNFITLQKLKPGTEYSIEVVAVTEEGIDSGRSERIIQVTAPNTPGAPVVKSFTATSAKLEWTMMKGATTYIVTITDQDTGNWTELDAGPFLEMEVVDLEPGTVYTFTVRGEDVEMGLRSEESASETQSTYPMAPELQIVSFTLDRISLAWEPVKGAVTYSVFYRMVAEEEPEKEIPMIEGTEYTIEDLVPGSEYEVQVQAKMQNGLRSERSLRIIHSTSPNIPTGLEISNVSTNSFSLSWIAAKGSSSYILVIENEETNEQSSVNVANKLTHTFTQLRPGTLYSVYAYALTMPDNTRSQRSETVQQRTLSVPPQGLLVFDVKEKSVALEWRKVKGASSYTVYVNKVGESDALERQVKKLETNEATIERLSSGTLYRFEVAAVTEYGLVGQRSDPVQQQTDPAPPQDIVISNVTSSSFQIEWSKSEGATSYTVVVVNEDTQDDRRQAVGDANTTRFDRLDPGTMYKVTIAAQRKDEDVSSGDSYRVYQKTLPVAPQNVRVVAVTTDSVALEWEASKGAVSYNVYIYELDEEGFIKGDALVVDFIEDIYVEIEITALLPGTEYQYEVYAVTSEQLVSEEAGIVTERTRYLAPTLSQSADPAVRLRNATYSSMLAEWDPIPHANIYTIVVRSELERDRFITDINDTATEIFDLTSGVEYSVTLIGIGRDGDETEESSPPAVLATMPLPPPTPTSIEAAEFTDNSVLITWQPASRAVSYEIEITDPETEKKRVISDIQQPSYNIKNLEPEKTYFIQVVAVGRFEKSKASEKIETGAKYPVPTMLFNDLSPMQVWNIQWDSMTLTFPVIQEAVSYTIVIRLNGEVIREISDLKSSRHEISNLTEVTEYEITYFAVGRGGKASEESDPPLFVITLPHTPEPPKGVGMSDQSSETVVVEWDDSEDAVSYDVIITDQSSLIPQFYENVTTPYIATGLVFDTHYTLTVVAVGRFDRSQPSKEVKFKTRLPKPGKIRLIVFQSLTETEASVLWSPAAYALSYTVTIRLNGKVVKQMTEILGNMIHIQDLKPGTEYEFGVKAIGLESGEGDEHSQAFTTLEGSVGQEEKDINEFGIDERTLDDKDELDQPGAMKFVVPESLEEALSSLITNMVEIPDDEVREDTAGKQVPNKVSLFRTNLWRQIEIVRKFLIAEHFSGGLGEKKSGATSVQSEEFKGAEKFVEKLILLSKKLKEDPKSFDKSGAKKIALEIAGLLRDIFIQTSELVVVEGSAESSGQEDIHDIQDIQDIQDILAPILEDLILEVVIGGMEISVSQVNPKSIVLTWTGKLPRDIVEFRIREAGDYEFLESFVVDETMTTVRFGRLDPNTDYEIFVVRGETRTIFSETVRTKEFFAIRPPAPRGLRITFAARSYVSVRWNPVNRRDSTIVYIVRLYMPREEKPIKRFKMQRATSKSITKLKPRTSYDVTVSSYNVDAKKQSDESPRIRIRTKSK